MVRCAKAWSASTSYKKHLPSICDACRFESILWAGSLNKNKKEKAVILLSSSLSLFYFFVVECLWFE
jgi:hypothetical protein